MVKGRKHKKFMEEEKNNEHVHTFGETELWIFENRAIDRWIIMKPCDTCEQKFFFTPLK